MDEYYIFTFGVGHILGGKAIKIKGTYSEARKIMIESFGDKWAFQYSEAAWKEMEKNPDRFYPMEKIIEVVE